MFCAKNTNKIESHPFRHISLKLLYFYPALYDLYSIARYPSSAMGV